MSAEFRVRSKLRGSEDLYAAQDKKNQEQGTAVPTAKTKGLQLAKASANTLQRAKGFVPPAPSNKMLWQAKNKSLPSQARLFGKASQAYNSNLEPDRQNTSQRESLPKNLQQNIARLTKALKTKQGSDLVTTITELNHLETVLKLSQQAQGLPLAKELKDRLTENLIIVGNLQNPKKLAEATKQLSHWQYYAQLQQKRAETHNLLEQAYPKEYRTHEIRSRKQLASDPYTLAKQSLSDDDQKQLANILADAGEVIEPANFKDLLQEITRLKKLYNHPVIAQFVKAYEDAQSKLVAAIPQLSWEHAIAEASTQSLQYNDELDSLNSDLQFLYNTIEDADKNPDTQENRDAITTRAKRYQQHLSTRQITWTQIDTALELQLEDAKNLALTQAESSGELLSAEERQMPEAGAGDDEDPSQMDVSKQDLILAKDPDVQAAKERLQWFRQALTDLNAISWEDAEALEQNLEELAGATELLAQYEKDWFQTQVENQLEQLIRIGNGYDNYLSKLHLRWERLNDNDQTTPQDYENFLTLLNMRKELAIVSKLDGGLLHAFRLYQNYNRLLDQTTPTQEDMARLATQVQILKGFASAKSLNAKHPKVIELQKGLHNFNHWLQPTPEGLRHLLNLSQEAALATNVEAKLRVWDDKEKSALLVDALINGAGLWESGLAGAEEIRHIRDQYSHIQVMLSQGRFAEAKRLFHHLETDALTRAWFQAAQDAKVFKECTITASIVVLSGGLAGAVASYVGGGITALNTGARGLNFLYQGARIAHSGKELQAAIETSLLVRGSVLGAKATTFVISNRYLNNSLQDDTFFDPGKSPEENYLELGKEITFTAGMFAAMGWAMRTYQVTQMKRWVPIARTQFRAAVGEEIFETMDELAQEAGISAELENMMRSGWSGLEYEMGSFGTELASFGAWDGVSLNLEANWQSLREGEGLTWENPIETLSSWEAWRHRFTFLIALKASGALVHPIPKPLANPMAKAAYARVKQAETKLAQFQKENPEHMSAEALTQLEGALQARNDYLNQLPKLNSSEQRHSQETQLALIAIKNLAKEYHNLEKIFGEQNDFGIESLTGRACHQYDPAKRKALLDLLTTNSPADVWSFYPESGLFEIQLKDPVTGQTNMIRLLPSLADNNISPADSIQAPQPKQNMMDLAQDAWSVGIDTFAKMPSFNIAPFKPGNVLRWLPFSLNMMSITPEISHTIEHQGASLEGRATTETAAIPLPSSSTAQGIQLSFDLAANPPSYKRIFETGVRDVPDTVPTGQKFTTYGKNPPRSDKVYDQKLSYMVKALLKNNPSMSPNQAWSIFSEIITSFESNPMPIKITAGTKMYKLVPKGSAPSQYTPFWLNAKTLKAITEDPSAIGNRLGLPEGSFASGEFDIYEMVAERSTTIYLGEIAPIGENGLLRFSTEDQVVVVDRNTNWSEPKRIGEIFDLQPEYQGVESLAG